MRKRLSNAEKQKAEQWHKTRVKVINFVARKPEIEKVCCICGKPGKILHNRENPYCISFICDECKKNPENIKIAELKRVDIRGIIDKDSLSINNFLKTDIINIVKQYLNTLDTLGEYCEKIGISRYQLNEMINKYELYYPNSNIKQRIRNKSKVIKNQRLKRIAEQKDISK